MDTSEPSAQKPREGLFARYLDPASRMSEIIFGVLIVMTFTLSFRAVDVQAFPNEAASAEFVRRLLLAAIGCTIAWGIIDGVMYLLTALLTRGSQQRLVRVAQNAPDETSAMAAIAEALDDDLAALSEKDRRDVYRELYEGVQGVSLRKVRVRRGDVLGAVVVACMAVIAVCPVVIPFLFVQDPVWALRTSNIIAIAMLYVVGARWARYADAVPWKVGLILAGVGIALMIVAIPLGG